MSKLDIYCTDGNHRAVISVRSNYSGSGLGSFGNFNCWPNVKADIPIPAGRKDIARKLAKEIRSLVEKFIRDNNLQEDKTRRTKENTRKEVWAEYGLENE